VTRTARAGREARGETRRTASGAAPDLVIGNAIAVIARPCLLGSVVPVRFDSTGKFEIRRSSLYEHDCSRNVWHTPESGMSAIRMFCL